jgi:hypothetical protein
VGSKVLPFIGKLQQELIQSLEGFQNPLDPQTLEDFLTERIGAMSPENQKMLARLGRFSLGADPSLAIMPVATLNMGIQPWQMTRQQFKSSHLFHGVRSGPKATRGFKNPKGAFTEREGYAHGVAQEVVQRFQELPGRVIVVRKADVKAAALPERLKGVFFQTEKEIPAVANIPVGKDAHRFLVSKALQEGKPVPAEVLKDYPELIGIPR